MLAVTARARRSGDRPPCAPHARRIRWVVFGSTVQRLNFSLAEVFA